MSRRPIAEVRVIRLPHLAAGCVRVEVECRHLTTGLTQVPGPMLALARPQMITAAVFEHEARCGDGETESAHARGDRAIREATDRAWDELLAAAQRRYVEGRRN